MSILAPDRAINTTSIDQANSTFLRGALAALHRAARRARELAAQTGTELIVSRGGVIERIKPQPDTAGPQVRESAVPYGDKP